MKVCGTIRLQQAPESPQLTIQTRETQHPPDSFQLQNIKPMYRQHQALPPHSTHEVTLISDWLEVAMLVQHLKSVLNLHT